MRIPRDYPAKESRRTSAPRVLCGVAPSEATGNLTSAFPAIARIAYNTIHPQLCCVGGFRSRRNSFSGGFEMLRKRALSGSLLGLALLGSLGYAQMKPPAENVSGKRHPNLAAAQRLCVQAFDKIQAAQAANEFDMDGHAAKAKEL